MDSTEQNIWENIFLQARSAWKEVPENLWVKIYGQKVEIAVVSETVT